MTKYTTKRKASSQEIRDIAAKILEALKQGKEPEFTDTNPGIIGLAYRLLYFEGFVRKRAKYELTLTGANHIELYGFVVYPNSKP